MTSKTIVIFLASVYDSTFKLRDLNFNMSWIQVLLLAALDLAGIYFNLKMLLACFIKKGMKSTFLRKYRPLVIWQFVYHVSSLALNTIEALSGPNVQHSEYFESCSVLKVLSIFINVLLVSNFTAMLLVVDYNPVVYRNYRFSPILLMLFPLCLGGSVLILCLLRHESTSQLVVVITLSAVLFAFLLVTWQKYTKLDQTYAKQMPSLSWDTFRDKKKACFAAAWFMCCAVAIALETFAWSSLNENICSYIMSSAVGIGLPIASNDLYEPIFNEKIEV